LAVLSRLALKPREVQFDIRSGVAARTGFGDYDHQLQIFGAQFEDDDETKQMLMTKSFLEQTNLELPTILIGDLNSMKRATGHIPEHPIRFMATRRLTYAAGDGAIKLLKERGLVEAGEDCRPAWEFGTFPFLQFDRMMYTPTTVEVTDFTVHKLTGSTNRAISAKVIPAYK
jgi:hypothetical protein